MLQRREFLKIIAISSSASSAGQFLSCQEHSREKPNIIFIMADDLGYGDLGCYGQQLIKTPNIDQLAEEGVLFTQAYAGSTVCAPSRCVLMTGLYNGHTAVRDNIPHYHTYLQEEHVTIAEILKKAGYRCGGVGKWSLGDAGTVGRATNQGFDTWFGYLNQDHAHYYYAEYLEIWPKSPCFPPDLALTYNDPTRYRQSGGGQALVRKTQPSDFYVFC